MPPAAEIRPALDFSLAQLAELLNRSFKGYFVDIHDTDELLAQRLRIDSIDLALSRVAVVDGAAAGLLYLSPRGWSCRVAGMGVVPEHRRHGLGRQLMEATIELARQRGFRTMLLEVIEQNTPALTLYQQLGFSAGRRLVGYQLDKAQPGTAAEPGSEEDRLQPVDPRWIAHLVALEGAPDLPWQLAAESVSAFGPPTRALALDDVAYALLSYVDSSSLILQTLLVRRQARGQGWGRRLIEALQRQFPGRSLKISARVPEDLADGFLRHLGFEHAEWTQRELFLDL